MTHMAVGMMMTLTPRSATQRATKVMKKAKPYCMPMQYPIQLSVSP